MVRTGHRVMFGLKQFRAFDADELYREAKTLPWEDYIEKDGYFRVDTAVRDTSVNDPRFAGLRVKDAVADRFMELFNVRPDSGPETNGVCLFLHWREKPGIALPRHHGRASAQARLPQTAAHSPHAGNPGRGLHPGRRMARNGPAGRPFHRAHVRGRHTGHRGRAHGPQRRTRPAAGKASHSCTCAALTRKPGTR